MAKTIFLASDSTCAFNDKTKFPCTGWGQVLKKFIDPTITIENHAQNGRSSKSFIEEGRLKVIDQKITEGDLLLVQFGHNDQKIDHRGTDPKTTYKSYLKEYIEVAKRHKAIPILISPVYRRYFHENGEVKKVEEVHGEYPDAMKQVAREVQVQFIDLCELSKDWLSSIGDHRSKKFYMNLKKGDFDNYPNGLEDNTHLTYEGATKIAAMIANEIIHLGGKND